MKDDRGAAATIVLFPIFAAVTFMFVQGAFWQNDRQLVAAAADRASAAVALFGASPGDAEAVVRQQLAAAGIDDIAVSISRLRGHDGDGHREGAGPAGRHVGRRLGELGDPDRGLSTAVNTVVTSPIRRRSDDRGAADVAAMIIVVPLGLAAVLLFVMFGRQGVAAEGVTHAAAVAARAASMERTASAATGAASAAASSTLSAAGTSCAGGPAVSVSASAWEPGGVVTVTVTCHVTGVASIGASDRVVSGTARATIDEYWAYEP